MNRRTKERAGFKSLDDVRECILAFVSFREAAELGLPLTKKPQEPTKEQRGR